MKLQRHQGLQELGAATALSRFVLGSTLVLFAHGCLFQAVLKVFADRGVAQMDHADHVKQMMNTFSSTPYLGARAVSKAFLRFPSSTGAKRVHLK